MECCPLTSLQRRHGVCICTPDTMPPTLKKTSIIMWYYPLLCGTRGQARNRAIAPPPGVFKNIFKAPKPLNSYHLGLRKHQLLADLS